jgi:hypothetical protein
MKRIILDHFRRWWLVLAVIFVAYFAIQAFSIRENNLQTSGDQIVASVYHLMINNTHNVFVFQAIMCLGFLVVWDIQRGLLRVLTSMPVTAKQIGRAWWLASVALPAIALGVIGLLALLIFSGGTNTMILLENYLMSWVLATLYLGAMFGAMTFTVTTIPNTFTDRIRTLLTTLLFLLTVFGFMFLQLETLTMTKTMLIFAAYVILSVVGWFRAEGMVLQRAGFRPAAQHSQKQPTQHKIPQSFGGLPYLAQKIFVQTTLIGLAITSWMTLWMSFFHFSHGQNHSQAVVSMIVDFGSIPYVFVLLFFISPIVFQLRFLRTLPISPSALAATLVFLPVFSIAAVGMIVIALVNFVAGEALILHTANGFLMLGAEAAVMVSLIVWRGLDTLTYLLIFLMVISESFIKLGMTIIFHLGSKTPERPWWINLTIFLLCAVGSLALTQRLLAKSSSAYRVRIMPANAWSMARR